MRAIAQERRRFGYRRLHVLLKREGYLVNQRWRRPPSFARVALYLTVMRQQPMALHARRSLIP
jgi:hypothetical protein